MESSNIHRIVMVSATDLRGESYSTTFRAVLKVLIDALYTIDTSKGYPDYYNEASRKHRKSSFPDLRRLTRSTWI